MKKFLAVIFVVFLHHINSFSQQYWGNTTTSNYTNEAIDVESDLAGNMYVAGYFSGGTSFEQNVAQIYSNGANDIYVSKYDANGNFLWVKTFGSNYSDKPTDLVVDHAGNIVITGQFFGQIAFGSTTLNSSGNSKDIFLAKLDNTGNVLWAKKEGGTDSENAYGLTVDGQNNIILTGQFKGSTLIAGQSITSMTDPSSNQLNYDMFVSKYSSAGTAQWIKTGQAKYEERGLSVDCDSQDNIFITGQFSDTLVFAGSTINNTSYTVGFVSKLSPSGTFLWLNQMKAGFVIPYDIEINNADEPVIIGDFTGAMVYYNSGANTVINSTFNKRIFVLKISNNGNNIWNSTFSSNNDLSARAVSINSAKDVFITGYFKCSWTQFHNASTATFNSVGFKDAYLIEIDNLGNFNYAKNFGSKLNDEGQGITFNTLQQAVICGTHTDNLKVPATNLSNYSFSGNPFNFSFSSFPQTHVSLIGDASANSFLTNAVHSAIPAYNYFYGPTTDTLLGYINSINADTVDFCTYTTLTYSAQTDQSYGPDYNYLWNNGATAQSIYIYQSGTYSVAVERADQCSSGGDTIVGVLHSTPNLPLLTNSLGLLNSAIYPDYTFCQPDSVIISFSNLCAGCTLQINPVNVSDTLPHVYDQAGLQSVVVSTSYCSNTSNFFIHIDSAVAYDTIKPYQYFVEDTDHNDTITICFDEYLHLHIYDSITNPTAILGQFFYEPTATYFINSNLPLYGYIIGALPQTLGHRITFKPLTTGWHVFTYTSSLGFNNTCGVDTTNYYLVDSIYIIVNPLPVGSASAITATDLLCPNGSVYLTVSPVYPNMVWSGPNIAYTSPNNDSVQVSSAGTYNYSGFLTDTITGCSDFVNNYFLLMEKQPPMIVSNPLDGIVCPGDSVTFSVPNNFVSYNWVGPDGANLSNLNTHTDADAGFYYCHLTDSTGCPLNTTPAELNEYTTPSLVANPQTVICSSQPIYLNVTFSGMGQVTWINPVSGGNSPQIIINQPGTYICQIDQCGILTTDSVVITDGSFAVNLTATDTILCFGDTSLLSVDPGYSSYNWNPILNSTNLNAVTSSGSYSVMVTNQYGCEAYSDTILLESVPFSFPPLIMDTSICIGDSITLYTPNSVPVDWYNSNFTFLSTDTSYSLPILYQDTLVYAAYNVLGCPTAFQDINVEILLPFVGGEILGDTIICDNETTILSLNLSQGTVQWFIDSIYSGSGATYAISGSQNSTIQEVMAIISNHCYSDTIYQTIHTIPSTILNLSADTIIICGNSTEILMTNTVFNSLSWTTPLGNFSSNFVTVSAAYPNGSYVIAQGISANGCFSNFDSTLILVPNGPQIDIYSSGIVCIGDSITLTSNINSNSLIWTGPFGTTTGAQVTFLMTNTAIVYNVTTFDSAGCSWNESITINSLPVPITFSADTIICFTDWLQLINPYGEFTITNNSGSPIDTLALADNSWVNLTFTNVSTGCSVNDSLFVQTVSCSSALPNILTANRDGINDYFVIDRALLQPNNSLNILNRWGNVVYKMDGYDNRWDGDLTEGVYFYTYIPDRKNSEKPLVQGTIHISR